MATKRLRGNSWVLSWSDPATGKQQRRVIGDRATVSESDADAALKSLEYELATGAASVLNLTRRQSRELWPDFAYRYLEWHRDAFPASHWRVKIIVEGHFAPYFDNLRLADLSMELAEQFVAHRAKHVAPSTVLKELRTLKAMLNKAVDWHLLPYNPIVRVRAPQDTDDAPVLFYTKDELNDLYVVATERNAAIWRLLANTGLRRSEALNLRWAEVSDTAITVVSRSTGRTKSAKWRHIPISPGARAALAVLTRGAVVADGAGRDTSSTHVLPRILPHSLTRQFDRDLSRAGLDGSLHKLRHTFASHLVMAGRPLIEVARLLGHADTKTTEIYAHLAPDHLQAAVSGINL